MVEYSYDAWGNCTINSTTTNYSVAHANPIRYRGYYYDEDTNLYYLNSRYYSPEFRRFISPDDTNYLDPETPNGLNLYCYCNNDPVNYADPSGHFSLMVLLLTALTCGIVAAGSNAIGQVVFDGKNINTMEWDRVAIAGASGFLAGLIPGNGFLSIVAQSVVSSITEEGLSTLILGDEFNIMEVAQNIAISSLLGLATNGLAKTTSKATSKIFIKGKNYSQYQHYFRKHGYNFTRLEVYDMIEKYAFGKELSDEIINNLLNLTSSVTAYRIGSWR